MGCCGLTSSHIGKAEGSRPAGRSRSCPRGPMGGRKDRAARLRRPGLHGPTRPDDRRPHARRLYVPRLQRGGWPTPRRTRRGPRRRSRPGRGSRTSTTRGASPVRSTSKPSSLSRRLISSTSLRALLDEADVERPGILDLGRPLHVGQRQHHAVVVAEEGDPVVPRIPLRVEPEVLDEEVPGSLDVRDGEVQVVQYHGSASAAKGEKAPPTCTFFRAVSGTLHECLNRAGPLRVRLIKEATR